MTFRRFLRCQGVNDPVYKVNSARYEVITRDIIKLNGAVGRMTAIVDLVSYLEKNKLGIRAVGSSQ